jgi:hypothetical protein
MGLGKPGKELYREVMRCCGATVGKRLEAEGKNKPEE